MYSQKFLFIRKNENEGWRKFEVILYYFLNAIYLQAVGYHGSPQIPFLSYL